MFNWSQYLNGHQPSQFGGALGSISSAYLDYALPKPNWNLKMGPWKRASMWVFGGCICNCVYSAHSIIGFLCVRWFGILHVYHDIYVSSVFHSKVCLSDSPVGLSQPFTFMHWTDTGWSPSQDSNKHQDDTTVVRMWKMNEQYIKYL